MTQECDHISKIIKFGYKLEDGQVNSFVELYGCTKCDATSELVPLYDIEAGWKAKEIDHTKCGGPDKCFGCKARGLQLNTGDANSSKAMPNKKWDGELNAYYQARKEGIQPEGTTMEKIQAAYKASETMGKAYDANDMPSASTIVKEAVPTLKEAGVI